MKPSISASSTYCLIAALFFAATSLRAQDNLVIESIDTSAWPTVRAKVYLLDKEGKEIRSVRRDDIVVTENGQRRSVASVTCPRGESVDAISSVLTIDVSGSMSRSGTPRGTENIELAKAAARAWIDALPDGGSECAVTAFDDHAVMLRDLARDRVSLRNAVEWLAPQKGTNYEAALLGAPAGALHVAARGGHRRAIVFLTDGLSNADPAPIVARALELNVSIFCVTLGMDAPPVLREIAEGTGGSVFENVTTLDQARAVYQAILFRAFGGEPCEIVWTSAPDCSPDRSVVISLPSDSLSGTATYRAPQNSVSRLSIDPPYAAIPAGGSEVPIRLSASARPIRIERIEPIRVDRGLSIELPAFPLTIAPGESRQIVVRTTAEAGGRLVGRWRVVADACVPAVITVRAGSGDAAPLIHLAAPNGGERFRGGDTALISWDGVSVETPVRLEYSIDAGATWNPVAENVSGGILPWRVPATPSERCLARVSTMTAEETGVPELSRIAALPVGGHRYALDTAADRIVGYLGDTTAEATHPTHGRMIQPGGRYGMWNASTGTLLKTWTVIGDELTSYKDPTPTFVEFSPDGRTILAGNYLMDANSGAVLWWIDGRPVNQQGYMLADVMTPSFSPDGSLVLLRVPKDGGEVLGVVDARTGRAVSTIGLNTLSVSTGVFTLDGGEIVTAARDGVALWNARTGALIRRFTDEESYTATASPDGMYVAAVYDDSVRVWNRSSGVTVGRYNLGKGTHGYRSARFAPDGSPVVWRDNAPGLVDMSTGDTTMTFIERDERRRPRGVPARVIFSPDGSHAVTLGGRLDNRTEVIVYDGETGRMIGKTGKGGSVVGLTATVTPDGSRLLWSFGDSLIIAPIEPEGASQDVSDDLWAIVGESKPAIADVDFGRVPVGRSRDSVIAGLVRNDGDAPMLVTAISVERKHVEDFALVSGVPPFEVLPGESRSVEFRFGPTEAGKRVAIAQFVIDGREVEGSLRGEGITESLRLELVNVDFGQAPVGEARDTIVPAMLRNTGAAPVTITGIRMIGPDTSSFEFTGEHDRFSISPGGSYPIALRFTPHAVGLFSTRVSIEQRGGEPLLGYVHGRGVGTVAGARYPDPTTFRTMAVPNAVIPPAGTFVAGTYDLLGLMAGYAFNDNVMILAGGAPPLPDDWGGVNGVMFGAYSLGLKVGTSFGDRWKIAAGFQWAQSIYDREETSEFDSRITAPTPYAAVSYGNDDRRVSLTAGYAFKGHRAVVNDATEAIEEFDRHAPIVALGGDWRFADRWKIVAEGIYMKTAGPVPLIATARWFGRTWALDFGGAFLGISSGEGETPSFPFAPVVSFVWVMGGGE